MSNRTLILRKPGHVVFDGVTFFSAAPITVEVMEETVEMRLQNYGKFDERPTNRMVSIKFTPSQFNASALAKLYPFGALAMGASILAGTDKPVDIHTTDDQRFRIPCGCVFKEPAASFGVTVPVLGEVEFRGLLPLNGDPAALASYLAESGVAYPGDTSWDPAEVMTPACVYAWPKGTASAWDSMDLAGPLVITPEASLVEDVVEGKGLVNISITDYKVTAAAEPMNITPALVLEGLGFGSALGSSKAALGRDLVINATGCFGRLYNAVLKAPAPLRYSAQERIIGGLTWEAQATFTTGAKNPLWLVSDEDPDAES